MSRLDGIPPGYNARALRLAATVLGPEDAPCLLVLHGLTASRRYWTPRILPLAEQRRVLMPDLPGFGRSPKPFVDYTMEFFIEALLGFLDQRGPADGRIGIVGHSLGALLALELAVRLGARVDKLVLLNVPRYQDAEVAHRILLDGSSSYRSLLTANSWSANLAQMRRTGLRRTARYLRRLPWAVLVDARKSTFRSISSTLEHCLLHYRVDSVCERLSPSTSALLIHGQHDQVAPVGAIRELGRYPAFRDLRVIPDAGHNPFHTHTRLCLRMMETFLRDSFAVARAGGET
jgi:pimeloyl-ACP methyl ester carboxylesterase